MRRYNKIGYICIRTLLFHFLLLFAISGSGQVEVRNPIISPAMDPIVTTETIVRDGVTFVRNSVPIPTGKVESSGLLLEKILPQEVTLNSEFTYEYRVRNLTPHHLINVAIHDKTSSNFEVTVSSPIKPIISDLSVSTWKIGNLGPRESKVIQIKGKAVTEGEITTRGWATFQTVMFDKIKATRADLELSVVAPQVSIHTQPIRYEVKVKNTGSSSLSGLFVSGLVPENLKSLSGEKKIEFKQNFLSPGAEMKFSFELLPQAAGIYQLDLKAISEQGAASNAQMITEVRAPRLQIRSESPSQRFIGKEVLVNLVVFNTGNAPARNATVQLGIPNDITILAINNGGRKVGSNIQWDLVNLPSGDSTDLSINVKSDVPGEYQFKSSISIHGDIAESSSSSVKFTGIPAIALEVKDLKDPVPVNEEFIYEITVTNQGTSTASNVIVVCELEETQEYVSTFGESAAKLGEKKQINGITYQEIIMQPLVRIDPKKSVSWKVSVKALSKGDVRFTVRMSSDQFPRPTTEVEPTYQY